MNNLYNIQNDILELLNNEELSQEEFQEKIQSLKWETYDKFDNIWKYIKNLEASVISFETAEKEFKEKKQTAKNTIERLKKQSSNFMNAIWKDKIETELFKYSFRKSTSINITNPDNIPEWFYTLETTKKIDKNIIKKQILEDMEKAGKEEKPYKWFKGAELVENKNLQFK